MRKFLYTVLLLSIIAGTFWAGFWYNQREHSKNLASGGRRILYYVDPMHPAYKSDKPGIAPDCGMELVPVYADNGLSGQVPSSLPVGTVRISLEKQQLIGVRVDQAKRAPLNHVIRTTGRVAPLETRIHRINASVDGWIKETSSNSVGTLVKKDEVLATFYSPQFLDAEQGYLYALGTVERLGPSRRAELGRKETPNPAALDPYVVQRQIDVLRGMGMGDVHIEEVGRTRQITQDIRLTSPATGFITALNVSRDQKFSKGAEYIRSPT